MKKGFKTFSCSVAVLLALVAVGAKNAYAEELTVTVKNGAEVAITPSVEGVFASTEDEGNTSASFSVSTDNYTGYDLSFTTGNTGEYATKLINTVTRNGETKTYVLNSIGVAMDAEAFNSNNYNNMWGVKPSKFNGVENLNYLPISGRMVMDNVKTSGTNEYTIAVGIRANYECPAGKYTNTLVLTAVANPTAYEVPVEFTAGTGITGVTFTKIGDEAADTAVTVSEANGKALLVYGASYEITPVFEEGYELDMIEVTGGELDGATNVYRIEITDEMPAVKVSARQI